MMICHFNLLIHYKRIDFKMQATTCLHSLVVLLHLTFYNKSITAAMRHLTA